MVELSKHIEKLLLTHNCVIVPGLGGFVTQYMPARFIAQENLFLPPYRSVGFNPMLTLNDGLLVQSYMQAYDTSYPETLKIITDTAEQVMQTLKEKGIYEFENIGTLKYDSEGKFDFTPQEAGVATPELYALDALPISRIENEENTEKPKLRKIKRIGTIKRSAKNYTLSINRNIANCVAAAIVAILLYFVWSPSIEVGTADNRQFQAAIINSPYIDKAASELAHPKPQAIKPASNNAETKIVDETAAEDNKANKGKFTIIIVSSVRLKNAEEAVAKYHKNGLDKAFVLQTQSMVRIGYGSYNTENEACNELKKLRNSNPLFEEAWVMKHF